jgi:hypothetical protein
MSSPSSPSVSLSSSSSSSAGKSGKRAAAGSGKVFNRFARPLRIRAPRKPVDPEAPRKPRTPRPVRETLTREKIMALRRFIDTEGYNFGPSVWKRLNQRAGPKDSNSNKELITISADSARLLSKLYYAILESRVEGAAQQCQLRGGKKAKVINEEDVGNCQVV